MADTPFRRGAGSARLVLSGASIILSDRVIAEGSLVLEDGRIAEVSGERLPYNPANGDLDCTGCTLAPGFIDVHVHGVEGADALDGGDVIARIAGCLPRYGVTAFCPTSVACTPEALRTLLDSVGASRTSPDGARVLPAHLESNFINPDFRGAQPIDCIRLPRGPSVEGAFTGEEILDAIRRAGPDVGIMTVAPELDAAVDLIRDLVAQGIRVSLGHSGATYEEARSGIEAGASQATHLFNRMTPLNHRAPGVAAAVLESDEIVAEVICDGVHVHPAMTRVAYAAKGPSGVMAITDGTGGAGLPRGSQAVLGGRRITVRDAAYLDDGTIAGSVVTMDRAFSYLVARIGLSLPDAARSCATTPARALGLAGMGEIARGHAADVVLLDRDLRVVTTIVAGIRAWSRA